MENRAVVRWDRHEHAINHKIWPCTVGEAKESIVFRETRSKILRFSKKGDQAALAWLRQRVPDVLPILGRTCPPRLTGQTQDNWLFRDMKTNLNNVLPYSKVVRPYYLSFMSSASSTMAVACSICVEPYNKRDRKAVECFSCLKSACQRCIQQYLLSITSLQSQCMFCRVEWSRLFLGNHVPMCGVVFCYSNYRFIVIIICIPPDPFPNWGSRRGRLSYPIRIQSWWNCLSSLSCFSVSFIPIHRLSNRRI